MATDRLLRATVTGPLNELDAAICNLVLDRQFHPLQASRFFRGRTKSPDTSDDGRLALDSAVALMSKLGVEPAFAEFRDRGYTPEDCAGYVSRVSAEAARVLAQKNAKLSLAADDEALCAALKPYEQLPVDIGELLGCHLLIFAVYFAACAGGGLAGPGRGGRARGLHLPLPHGRGRWQGALRLCYAAGRRAARG